MLVRSNTSHNLSGNLGTMNFSGNLNIPGNVNVGAVPSPKFAETGTSKSIPISPKKTREEFTLRRVDDYPK